MIRYLKWTGRLLAMGREQHHGAPLHASMVDYLKFETADGKSRQVHEVVVPSLVHSTLAVGDAGEFDLIVMEYPKPFGTYSRYFLAGLRTGRGEVDATPEVRRWVAASKGGAIQYFWIGLILMPGFGIGLFFWICACRLLFLKQPEAQRAS